MEEIKRKRKTGGMTKDERRDYMKVYMKEYMKPYNKLGHNKIRADLAGYVYVSISGLPCYSKATPVNESAIEIEDETCSYFKCGKTLSLVEKLCGSVCMEHMGNSKQIFHNGKI